MLPASLIAMNNAARGEDLVSWDVYTFGCLCIGEESVNENDGKSGFLLRAEEDGR